MLYHEATGCEEIPRDIWSLYNQTYPISLKAQCRDLKSLFVTIFETFRGIDCGPNSQKIVVVRNLQRKQPGGPSTSSEPKSGCKAKVDAASIPRLVEHSEIASSARLVFPVPAIASSRFQAGNTGLAALNVSDLGSMAVNSLADRSLNALSEPTIDKTLYSIDVPRDFATSEARITTEAVYKSSKSTQTPEESVFSSTERNTLLKFLSNCSSESPPDPSEAARDTLALLQKAQVDCQEAISRHVHWHKRIDEIKARRSEVIKEYTEKLAGLQATADRPETS